MASSKDYALITVLFLAEFSRGAFFLAFLPLYTTEFFGWTVATAGLAASVHYFAETLVKSFAGWQLDRFGRPVLLAGLVVGLAALVMARIYSHPVSLVAFSGLFGLGFSPLWIGVFTEVAPTDKKDRSSRIGLVFAAWLAGMGSGLAAINFFISVSYDFAFLVIILFFLAALIIAWLFYPSVSNNQPGPGISPAPILPAIRHLAVNKAVSRVLLPTMFLQTLSGSLLIPVLPVFARTSLGLSHDGYGLLVIAGGLAMVLFLIPMGRLADKTNLKTILFAGMALASAALSGLALAGNKDNAVIISLILGISYAAVLPAWNTLLAKAVPPERQATGWGIFSTVEGLGIAVGPAMGGVLARYFNPVGTLLAAAGILSLMALFYLVYPVERFFKTGVRG
ncbi:MAG: MFS transporter [Bacillota bacterium]